MKKYNAKNSKASSEPVEATDISNTLLSSKSEAIEYGAYIGLDVHKDTIAPHRENFRQNNQKMALQKNLWLVAFRAQ